MNSKSDDEQYLVHEITDGSKTSWRLLVFSTRREYVHVELPGFEPQGTGTHEQYDPFLERNLTVGFTFQFETLDCFLCLMIVIWEKPRSIRAF